MAVLSRVAERDFCLVIRRRSFKRPEEQSFNIQFTGSDMWLFSEICYPKDLFVQMTEEKVV